MRADVIALESTIGGQTETGMAQATSNVAKARTLVALCERISNNATLARQVRLRFAQSWMSESIRIVGRRN
jgi:hypothetical protein